MKKLLAALVALLCGCALAALFSSCGEVEEHVHTFTAYATVKPACEEAGYTVYSCACGEYYTGDITQPVGHDFGPAEFVWTECGGGFEATCVRTCLNDGSHREEAKATVTSRTEEATCTKAGFTEYVAEYGAFKGVKRCVLPAQPQAHTPAEEFVTVTAADCAHAGKQAVFCVDCGAVLQERELPALGHLWEFIETAVAADCVHEGEDIYACSRCGEEKSQKTAPDPQAHKAVEEKEISPTCTQNGKTVGERCANCGIVLKERTDIPALGHDWEFKEISVAADCIHAGEEIYACCRCGEEKSQKTAPNPQAHKAVKDKEISPTCTQNGKTVGEHCELCGIVLKKQADIPALGHSWEFNKIALLADCVHAGEDVYACSRCGEEKSETTAPDPQAHKAVEDKEIPPTCTQNGKTVGEHCELCGVILKAQNEIPALGHDKVYYDGKAPDCVTEGWKAYSICSRCGLSDYEKLPALGHDFGDGLKSDDYSHWRQCSRCALKECIAEHSFGEIMTFDGEYHCRTCVQCTKVRYEKHAVITTPAVPPTCTEVGFTENSFCEACGQVLTARESVPATGHKPVEIAAVTPSCTQSGLTRGESCSVCGEILIAQTQVPPTGHSAAFIQEILPTCTTEGCTAGSYCTTCDCVLEESKVVPATGHTWGEWTVTEQEHDRKCSVCGETERGMHGAEAGLCNVCGCSVGMAFVFTGEGYALADAGSSRGQKIIVVPAYYDDGQNGVRPVTEVFPAAFAGNVDLTEVYLPHTVKTVGDEAFAGCVNLNKAHLPSGVALGNDVFKDCAALTAPEYCPSPEVCGKKDG